MTFTPKGVASKRKGGINKQPHEDYLPVLGECVEGYLEEKTALCHRDKGTYSKEEDVIGSITQEVEKGG